MSRLRICLDFLRRREGFALVIVVSLCAFYGQRLVGQGLPSQVTWSAVGPAGGDARALAAVAGQPNHLYLGTSNSWVYESMDQGGSWHRLAKLDPSEDLVVANILVDSTNASLVFAGGYKPDQRDGGLWLSRDGGRHWNVVEALRGQSIFSLAQAPSEGNVLFAGTLLGVYRSSDAGASWTLISPPDSHEIHEVESLAIDPLDAKIVYAGTWHLPWKTTDGGKTWHSIKKGVIEDSDVFSIIIDPVKPHIVFLSACSGIYKSENGGELFHKIEGIPSTARRTRVLMQDPENRETVYAGTTEGLYKTEDGGKSFQRMTGADVVVNGVYVDPGDSSHVLMATDRGGIMASQDGAVSFAASNEGFSGRKVSALLVDRTNPRRILAGVVNDKSYGGVFVSNDGGVKWEQIGEGPGGGLEGRDVFVLAQAPDGTVVAGTNHGIFALETVKHGDDNDAPAAQQSAAQAATNRDNEKGQTPAGQPASAQPASAQPGQPVQALKSDPIWQPRNTIANTAMKPSMVNVNGTHVNVEKRVENPAFELQSHVNALDLTGDVWLASTGFGLLTSKDQGKSWQGGPVMGTGDYLSVAVHGDMMTAARPDGVVESTDSGLTWMPMGIPTVLTRIQRVVFSADGTLWLGAREGVYFTRDKGKTWLWIDRLPFRDVDDIYYDAVLNKVLVSSRTSDQIYALDPKTLAWKWWQTGYRIGLVRAAGERVVAASLYDGVLVEPAAAKSEIGHR
jgi:photosystem II stability/assembly factor-like uncharacterized protein